MIVAITPGLGGNVGASLVGVGKSARQSLRNINANFAGITGGNGLALNIQKLDIVKRYRLTHRADLVAVAL